MKVTVSRRAHFNAAHRLYKKDWSNEKNDAVFGKCNNPNFHGHNYELVVGVTGEIDPETGYVMDIKELSDNLDVPEFSQLNPTAENIAVVIWNKLRQRIDAKLELEVTLFETPRNSVTYRGD